MAETSTTRGQAPFHWASVVRFPNPNALSPISWGKESAPRSLGLHSSKPWQNENLPMSIRVSAL